VPTPSARRLRKGAAVMAEPPPPCGIVPFAISGENHRPTQASPASFVVVVELQPASSVRVFEREGLLSASSTWPRRRPIAALIQYCVLRGECHSLTSVCWGSLSALVFEVYRMHNDRTWQNDPVCNTQCVHVYAEPSGGSAGRTRSVPWYVLEYFSLPDSVDADSVGS
jgi:hypothetical protein